MSMAQTRNFLNCLGNRKKEHGFIITRNSIQTEAMKWSKKNHELSQNFKVSRGWLSRFMIRNNLVLCQKTKIAQKLPKDLED